MYVDVRDITGYLSHFSEGMSEFNENCTQFSTTFGTVWFYLHVFRDVIKGVISRDKFQIEQCELKTVM